VVGDRWLDLGGDAADLVEVMASYGEGRERKMRERERDGDEDDAVNDDDV